MPLFSNIFKAAKVAAPIAAEESDIYTLGLIRKSLSAARHMFIGGETIAGRNFGGGIRRMLTGALAGGAINMMRADYEDSSTAKFKNFTTGALVGAALGGLTTSTAMRAARYVGRTPHALRIARMAGVSFREGQLMAATVPFSRNVAATALEGGGLGRRAIGGMYRGTRSFVEQHPRLTVGIGLGAIGYGMFHKSSSSPARRMADYGEDFMNQDRGRGVARQGFQSSTEGLTLGLHRGRHR
jgi:hypothetical protein